VPDLAFTEDTGWIEIEDFQEEAAGLDTDELWDLVGQGDDAAAVAMLRDYGWDDLPGGARVVLLRIPDPVLGDRLRVWIGE
jgi:hypothetical protein